MGRLGNDAIAVFTDESVQFLLRNGYTEAWDIGENAAESYQRDGIDYVICTRSTRRKAKVGDQLGDEPPYSAFLVAKISAIELLPPNAKGVRRSKIHFDSYANIAVPEFWIRGHRRPEFRRIAELEQGPFDRVPLVLRPLVDSGSAVSFNREGHSVDPKHAFIVDALKSELQHLGWWVEFGDQSARPDLVVSNGSVKILFEVKPDDLPASFYCAIGQLLVYSQAIEADRKVIVASGYPKSCRESFKGVLTENSIEVIEFRGNAPHYEFAELRKVLG